MKLVLGRALFRAACCFLGVVIIIAGIRFMVRFQSSGHIIDILTQPGLGHMDRSAVAHLLGIDRPWYMDFWPF